MAWSWPCHQSIHEIQVNCVKSRWNIWNIPSLFWQSRSLRDFLPPAGCSQPPTVPNFLFLLLLPFPFHLCLLPSSSSSFYYFLLRRWVQSVSHVAKDMAGHTASPLFTYILSMRDHRSSFSLSAFIHRLDFYYYAFHHCVPCSWCSPQISKRALKSSEELCGAATIHHWEKKLQYANLPLKGFFSGLSETSFVKALGFPVLPNWCRFSIMHGIAWFTGRYDIIINH